jgi:hypothetical protein
MPSAISTALCDHIVRTYSQFRIRSSKPLELHPPLFSLTWWDEAVDEQTGFGDGDIYCALAGEFNGVCGEFVSHLVSLYHD